MPITNNRADNEQLKFCDTVDGPAVRVCGSVSTDGGGLGSSNDYTGTFFQVEEYNGYIVDDDSPTEYTVYYFDFGVELFHVTIIQDQTGSPVAQKLGPQEFVDEIRYIQSIVTNTDIVGKTVCIFYAIGNENKDTTFNLVDATGYFNYDSVNAPNTITLASAIPSGTYNFDIEANDGTNTITETITVTVA